MHRKVLSQFFIFSQFEESMNNPLPSNQSYSYGGATGVAVRNSVLRNTYWLLALSMLPTMLGAWLGVSMNINLMGGSPFMSFILFMAIAMGFIFAIEKFKNSGIGVALLLGFTFFLGLMLAPMIGMTLGSYRNGSTIIMMAAGSTAAIFGVMATIATVSKRDFSGLGKWLFVGLILAIVASVANIWLQLPALMLTISVISTAIFSAYILYDVQSIVNGGETNYVSATLRIYLDIYNIFANLLAIFGIVGGDRD